MNYRMISSTIGKILMIIGVSMLLPMIVAIIYSEALRNILTFLGVALFVIIIGFGLVLTKPRNTKIYSKEGLVIVGLSWFIISLVGCLPFIISGEIPSFVDAFFETVSGFTTTGMSALTDVECLSKSILFWRSQNHFLGGMGVLVFILAFLPNANASSINIIKSESSGPQVSKIVSKVKYTAEIMYLIYVGMFFVLAVLLLFSGIGIYDSIVVAFGAAGTGGFSIYNTSIAHYDSRYIEILLTIFLPLFAINFNVYYLILIGKIREAFKCEELFVFIGLYIVFVTVITIDSIKVFGSLADALRQSAFHTSSIMTSTGYTATDINQFNMLSKFLLMFMMFTGGCSGSTSGGFKLSRLIIVIKAAFSRSKNVINPRTISVVKLNGKKVEDSVVNESMGYLAFYIMFFLLTIMIISIDNYSLETSVSCSLSALGGIGANFGSNTALFPWYTKIVLSIDMMIGRLEIFPVILLFSPKTWSKV